jgi:hypothetical protein
MKINGALSFRLFKIGRPLPEGAVEQFAKAALPSLEALTNVPIHGWVTGRHNLDRNITQESAYFGGYLRLALATAEKKIPGELLRAECRMEEEAHCKATGQDRVSSATRAEIRKAIEDRLRPQALPAISSIPLVYDNARDIVYAGAMTDRQYDAMQISVSQAIGFGLLPLFHSWTPNMMPEFAFTVNADAQQVVNEPGVDFLTWLWFMSETQGGMLPVLGLNSVVSFGISGPLHFVMQGNGCFVTNLSAGNPLVSAEAKAALLAGKKLARAKVTFAIGDRAWVFTYDGLFGKILGLKTPIQEKLDPISAFQERMDHLAQFTAILHGLYDQFIAVRMKTDQSDELLEATDAWIKERKVRS